jgi:hypothetical protein
MFNNKSIVLLIALAMSNLAHADLTTGLVAYYPFNGNANDESGNGNNGTIIELSANSDREIKNDLW